MVFKLSIVAILAVLSSVVARPSRAPECIEDANPFDDPCFSNIRDEAGTVALENRDGLGPSNDSQVIQFADTFTHTNRGFFPGNLTANFPTYPQGLALSYPGFNFFNIKNKELLMPSPPQVLLTDPSVQDMVGRQPSFMRQSNTSSFDVRSFRFACAHYDEVGQISIPSCLVAIACWPRTSKDTGIANGHRPTPRPMVMSSFEFIPNLDTSSLTWSSPVVREVNEEDLTPPTTLYANANLGGNFYDLDHCYITLQQYSSPNSTAEVVPSVLIDNVVGVAYYSQQET